MDSQNNAPQRPLAVVTGASDGIGYELARQLAARGYDLIVCADDPGIAEARQAFAQLGVAVEAVLADLSTYEGVELVVAKIRDAGRPAAVAVLNAGVGVGGAFIDTDLQVELDLLALNVVSTVHLAKCIVRFMAAAGGGRILFTSSIAGTMPTPYESVYGASKAFIQSFASGLRYELEEKGISVTALLPGATATNFFHRAGMDETKIGKAAKDDPAEVAEDGLEALFKGDAEVVAGSLKNKAYRSKLVPDAIKARVHAHEAQQP